MTKLATRGRATAEAIRDRKVFTTHGALQAIAAPVSNAGRLSGEDRERFHADCERIVYAVYSYATPIAWVRADGQIYRVKQRFSVTTSKHQGTLYLLGEEGSH
jgi:hypothetical protein